MVNQPLLPYCPSPMTVYNHSIIKMRYAQSGLHDQISPSLVIWIVIQPQKNNCRLNCGECDTHMVVQSCKIVGCLLGEVLHLIALVTWPTGSYSWPLASVMVKLAQNTVYSLH